MERKRMGRPRKEECKKCIPFTINLPREMVQWLDEEAERLGATRSETIRRVLAEKYHGKVFLNFLS